MKFLGIHVGYKNQNRVLFILCLILVLIFIYLYFIRNKNPSINQEGFSQEQPFLVKRDQEVYDGFLAEIYDGIYKPATYNHYIFDAVERLTQPSKEHSVILDAGCGTGELLEYVSKKGYKFMYGVDLSKDMIIFCQEKIPNCRVKEGDLLIPMTYDKATFHQIFLTGDTIYHVDDKLKLLYNLYNWLVPNGYLILHLYDPINFNPIPMSARPLLVDSLQDYSNERITNSQIDFTDFIFKSLFDFNKENTAITYQETFVDKNTQYVRQNERTMYMNQVDEIIQMCQYVGFLVHGQFNMSDSLLKDPYQYVFILEKPN